MHMYKVSYKSRADKDGQEWNLGRLPNVDYALSTFNSTCAGPEGLGQFTFEETTPFNSDYVLYEQDSDVGSERGFMIWLVSA